MNRTLSRWSQWGVLLLGLLLAAAASADDDVYDFEMIVFERPSAVVGTFSPETSGDPGAVSVAGRLDAMAIGDKKLGPVAYTLRKKGMLVLEHIAWRQVPRGRDSDTWYEIGDGRLGGLIRLTRGRFLHLDADLALREPGSDQPVHIKFNRRMRSGELHYVDHPKLGILIQAERYTGAADGDSAESPSSGEPKPAQPDPT